MSYLKSQVSFSFNFASLFIVLRDNSYMILTKGAHQTVKYQSIDYSDEISPSLCYDRLLLLKVYKIAAKKVQRSYASWHWRVLQNLKKKQFVFSKMTRIWWILIRALKSLKNLHFDWSLSWKIYNVWPRKVKRIIFHNTEEPCKVWRKLTCGSENESIQNFIIAPHILQCSFVRGSNKKQRTGRTISDFKKRETFSFLMTIKCSWGWSNNVALLLAPFKNGFPFPFSLVKKRINLDIQLKGELTDFFWELPGCSLFPRVGVG